MTVQYTNKPSTCSGCPWEKTSNGYACGNGPTSAKLAVVAESLGENEAIQGIPLVGWSGRELNQFLRAHTISRQEVYCDNVIRCKPPTGTKKKIPKEVIEFCTEVHLKPALELVKPNTILALGDYSLSYLTGRKGISKHRGSLLWSDKFGVKVVPTFHPAWLVKGESARVMYPFVEFDVGKAVKESASNVYTAPVEKYSISPTLDKIRAIRDKILLHLRVAVDIETSGGSFWNTAPLCVGLYCLDEAVCVPLLGQYGADVWSQDSLREVIRILAEILANTKIVKIFQNGPYDIGVLRSIGFIVNGYEEDTMIKHHAIIPERGVPHDLAFIGSVYTDIPYYKDDVKGADNFALLENNRLRTYNCRDTKVTWDSDANMDPELDELDVRPTYRQDMALIEPIMRIQERGVLIDQELLRKYRAQLDDEIDEAATLVKRILGDDFVSLSKKDRHSIRPSRMKQFLFDELKLTPVGYTKSHEPRTDVEALLIHMEEVQENLHPLFEVFIEWRKADKLRNTYFDEFILDPNGRVHTQYTIHVTPTGRLSSRGPNLQNIPEGIAKEIFIASPGFDFVEHDYSQIELRALAYITDDDSLIELFESGKHEIHRQNAADIFNVPYDQVTYDQRVSAKTFIYGGVIYGGQAATIRRQIVSRAIKQRFLDRNKGIQTQLRIPSVADIERCQNEWFTKHPKVKEFQDAIEREVRAERKLRTTLGRVRIFIGNIDDVIRAAYNFPIQGTASDIVNRAFIRLHERIRRPSGLVLQVHDSLIAEVEKSYTKEYVGEAKKIMEEPVEINGKKCIFPVDCKVGPSWARLEKVAT